MSSGNDPIALFRVRRRVGLWVGAALPGLMLVVALLGWRLALLPWWANVGSVAVAIALSTLASRQYKCPFCGQPPEEDLPLFYPASCFHCNAPLR